MASVAFVTYGLNRGGFLTHEPYVARKETTRRPSSVLLASTLTLI